jgi:acetylornithine deacetylase/succinyl-diaminopimelate desuccinylase-like protein
LLRRPTTSWSSVFGLPDDGNHAPNEHFRLEQFHGATQALLRGFAGYRRRAA